MTSLKNKVLLSFIIPIYNPGNNLVRCIKSIQKQKLRSCEIILVEDRSTDTSLEICRKFEKKYKNIRLIKHEKRMGVSISRNDGIQNSNGEFIIFVDSDDYLIENSLLSLEKYILKNRKNDLIFINNYVTLRDNKFFKTEYISKKKILKKKDILDVFLKEKDTPIECWKFIYKKFFLIRNKILFIKKVNLGEDQAFVSNAICKVDNLPIYLKPYYCFEVGSSNLRNKTGFNPAVSLLKVICGISKLYNDKEKNYNIKKFLKNKIQKPLTEFKTQIIPLNNDQINKLSQYIKKNFQTFKKLNYLFPNNNFLLSLKKYGAEKGLNKFKNNLIIKINSLLKNKKFNDLYVFGYSFYSLAVIHALKKKDYKVKLILDNNSRIKKKRSLNLDIVTPKIFFKRLKDRNNLLIIICNQSKEDVLNICNQLKKFEINKNQITHINFRNLDKRYV
tara:strand:+ start:10143 stop:11480 length:1338 start_codon:yes stop_codon:yes gene_type:complete